MSGDPKMKTKHIKILVGFSWSEGKREVRKHFTVKPGDVIETPAPNADALIQANKAVEVSAPVAAPEPSQKKESPPPDPKPAAKKAAKKAVKKVAKNKTK